MPLAPILMQPAWRHGAATPWGGARLKELYDKDTPDPRTGESLEISALKALPSLDDEGTPLTRLLERYGKALMGSDIKGDFPLLLKLIDARDRLSVQVHPDDAYAQRYESQSGKTEAWVILHAEPGAKIVYGLKEGVEIEDLKKIAQDESQIEGMLRLVDALPGDVFFIPAGMVHAIGAGIVLYEIQQASDVTYRFYDWQRRDQHGNLRPLHIKQVIDVARPELRLDKAVPEALPLEGEGQRERLLDTDHFELERWRGCKGAGLMPDRRRFGMLTALMPATLRYEEKEITLPAGQSVLLPAQGEELLIDGEELLIAWPAVK